MFWRSVVGKLSLTILLLVSFVLTILSIFLMEFFENYHIREAEDEMYQDAMRISTLVEQNEEPAFVEEMVLLLKDPASRVAIVYGPGNVWISAPEADSLDVENVDWLRERAEFSQVTEEEQTVQKLIYQTDTNKEMILVGIPLPMEASGIFLIQSLDIINQTKQDTTKLILLSAGIAIMLTAFFAVFLSSRITSPLLKMREAAYNLTRGEFNTKVPVLTHDEIGELAIEFNRMGRQLKFHINALNQEKEQLSSIVSSMADGVITLNRNADIIVINPPAQAFIDNWFFEHDKNEHVSVNLPNDLHAALEKVIQDEEPGIHEMGVQGRNYVMLMTPLYDQSYVRGAVAVIRDMTEERRLDKLRKDFIANVSHELRTPISLMQGYSEAIVDDIASTVDDKNDLAKIIHEESLRMSRLVNELLDIARMEAGQISLQTEEVDVEAFNDRIVHKFSNLATESKIDLKLDKTLEQPNAYLDPDRVEQVYTNLIDNAIRHTAENGYVRVHVHNDADQLTVDVTDNGSGIPEEDLPFVFERFYKADKSRERNKQKKGTGLGLAIAKNIIEAHGGTIQVKSKPGHGTTFTFRIPHEK